jgi:hypothetical protein
VCDTENSPYFALDGGGEGMFATLSGRIQRSGSVGQDAVLQARG